MNNPALLEAARNGQILAGVNSAATDSPSARLINHKSVYYKGSHGNTVESSFDIEGRPSHGVRVTTMKGYRGIRSSVNLGKFEGMFFSYGMTLGDGPSLTHMSIHHPNPDARATEKELKAFHALALVKLNEAIDAGTFVLGGETGIE